MDNKVDYRNIYEKYLIYPLLLYVILSKLSFLYITILPIEFPQLFYTLGIVLEVLVIAFYAYSKGLP